MIARRIFGKSVFAALSLLIGFGSWSCAQAQIRIVAIGDSNLAGKGVSRDQAYPAQLERALKARGLNVTVTNAGINGDTTTGVLARLDSSVSNGTDLAIVSVGVNDRVLHGASEASIKANRAEITRRLRVRGIQVIDLPSGKDFQGSIASDPKYHVEGGAGSGPAPGTTNWHLTGEGYAIVVARTLPQVLAALKQVKPHS